MELLTTGLHFTAGWAFWSLSHYVGHRWWHDDMKKGKQTFYAHGERQHHRLYDGDDRAFMRSEDPQELFISFPYKHVATVAVIPVALYGWLVGWLPAAAFGVAMYGSMTFDHQLHRLFHRRDSLPGLLGRLREMHRVHHATHTANFFFVSGFVWDLLMRTVVFPPQAVAQAQSPVRPAPPVA